jgi:hypothetical protein
MYSIRTFLKKVEDLIARGNGVGCLDALVEVCLERGLELEAVAGQIKTNKAFKAFKAHLAAEARQMKMLK